MTTICGCGQKIDARTLRAGGESCYECTAGTGPLEEQIDAWMTRATVGTVKGWAVTWRQYRRRFSQTIWFPTREQADQFGVGLRNGDEGGDVERLLMKAWGRPRAITAAERGRLGGPARAAALSPERRREIAKKASDAAHAGRARRAAEQIDAKQIDGGQ